MPAANGSNAIQITKAKLLTIQDFVFLAPRIAARSNHPLPAGRVREQLAATSRIRNPVC
jgi:hypothetical protein